MEEAPPQTKYDVFDYLVESYYLGRMSLDDVVVAYHEICEFENLEPQDGR